MKKERRGITLMLLGYSLAMLLIFACTIFFLEKRWERIAAEEPSHHTVTEKYVYVYQDSAEIQTEPPAEDCAWIVKEHEKKIGIFSEDGSLLRVLDIYTNTLPSADQRLLREGIVVTSQSELYALIEDYSE